MSLDFMIVGSLDGDRPVGRLEHVVRCASSVLGIDLRANVATIGGVRFEIDLAVEGEEVTSIQLTPLGRGDHEHALRLLASTLGAFVFDPQTGFELGVEPPDLPDRTEHYVIDLVSLDLGPIGPDAEARLSIPRSGPGWTIRVTPEVNRVRLHAQWSTKASRDELFAEIVQVAEQNAWVPFDPQRNDTLT